MGPTVLAGVGEPTVGFSPGVSRSGPGGLEASASEKPSHSPATCLHLKHLHGPRTPLQGHSVTLQAPNQTQLPRRTSMGPSCQSQRLLLKDSFFQEQSINVREEGCFIHLFIY